MLCLHKNRDRLATEKIMEKEGRKSRAILSLLILSAIFCRKTQSDFYVITRINKINKNLFFLFLKQRLVSQLFLLYGETWM